MPRSSLLILCALSACALGAPDAQWGQTPRADAPVRPSPQPIVNTAEFVQVFQDLCLVSPAHLSDFETAAKRLGLRQTQAPSNLHTGFAWESLEHNGGTAQRVSVGTYPIVYEIIGDPSGFPNRQRRCAVTAFLSDWTPQNNAPLNAIPPNALLSAAQDLDFSPYAENYAVQPGDITVDVEAQSRGSYVDLRPEASCPKDDPCWALFPASLTLTVVVGRIR